MCLYASIAFNKLCHLRLGHLFKSIFIFIQSDLKQKNSMNLLPGMKHTIFRFFNIYFCQSMPCMQFIWSICLVNPYELYIFWKNEDGFISKQKSAKWIIRLCSVASSVGTYFVNKLFCQQRLFFLGFLGFLHWKSIAEYSLTFQKSRLDIWLENILKRLALWLGFLFLWIKFWRRYFHGNKIIFIYSLFW